jgi:serine/threonine-protein kinase
MYEDAISVLEKGATFQSLYVMATSALGYAHAIAGNTDRAREIFDELLSLSNTQSVDPVLIGQVYIGLGDFDEALDWLEKGYEARSMHLAPIGSASCFDRVRDHPRFVELLRKMGLHD